ncbi:hypothetical protein GF420_07630, partial [candidate division GN15 bacterium]|nr:hypothetical protein [candidate division GN15 bacterium]
MKLFGLYKSVVVSVVLIGVVGLLACSVGNEGQVPLTTSSAEAREHFVQGRALLEKLRAQEAVPHFERAVKADPSFAMAHLYLASAQQTPKQFFESYHRAVTLIDNVSKGERLWILGFQAGVNGDSRKQEQYYQRLVEAYPNDVRAVTLLG